MRKSSFSKIIETDILGEGEKLPQWRQTFAFAENRDDKVDRNDNQVSRKNAENALDEIRF